MSVVSDTERIERLEQRLARLEDVQAITDLKERYATLCDDGYDADGIAELCVEDCVWSSNVAGEFRGRDEIRRFMRETGEQLSWAQHFMISPAIEVDPGGERATGRWFLLALATQVAGAGEEGPQSVLFSGNYEDAYVKVDGAWRFERIALDMQIMTTVHAGWADGPIAR